MLFKSLSMLLGMAVAQTPENLRGRWRAFNVKQGENGKFD